ncbi:helix-turn-helix transcriptional regulator [Hymenobacter cheonanensis]|uniref:helix-turn-helix transcriptional regulator n=1 Tax=Hymenobacter sp. CA2-7 TaxID=3063993 RepID=UPI0027138675|nr:helix-turn-helix transcriptional regulator [Hymenobacter sp. CA2-7]MDO7885924.1 helix-turn-helix transcriptional regulator [Hymenobacter sp. CA2-7]
MKPVPIDALYAAFTPAVGDAPPDMRRELGHFDVFTVGGAAHRPPAHFNRQAFYKISLSHGCGRLEFGGQAQEVGPHFLFMATPSLLYRWTPTEAAHTGCFCIFTDEFLLPAKGGVLVEELPLFRPGAHPVIEVTAAECQAIEAIFEKMTQEMASTYAYKYDLLRTYLVELIHLVQKLQPAPAPARAPAAARLAAQFAELLERQFPRAAPASPLRLRTAKAYADALAVHVVHLNRVLKEATGHTTTALISNRLAHEAKLLLKQTTQNVSEIADYLGFTDAAHFCTFFKRQTGLTPGDFRQ